jgi:hypothetical protein
VKLVLLFPLAAVVVAAVEVDLGVAVASAVVFEDTVGSEGSAAVGRVNSTGNCLYWRQA